MDDGKGYIAHKLQTNCIFYYMINYGKEIRISNLKYSILSFFRKYKFLIMLFLLIIIMAILTGLFTGAKLYAYKSDIDVDDFSFNLLLNGDVYSLKIFLVRYLSIVFFMFLMLVLSTTLFTSLFAYVLIAYRTFLLSLNCTLIVLFMGLSGIINGIIIILPCQILNTLTLVLMFVICRNVFKEKKRCGYVDKSKFKNLWFLFLLAFIVNMVECVLLLLFKSTTILII